MTKHRKKRIKYIKCEKRKQSNQIKFNRLEHVLKFTPLKDTKGKYIPYCNFGWHQGISLNPSLCEERYCTHYSKLYIK